MAEQRRRTSDREWTGWSRIVHRFRLVQVTIGLVVTLAVMFGFGFKTPAAHFRDIETTATIIDARVQMLEQDRRTTQRYIRILVLAKCFELPRKQAQMIGLPCDSLQRHGPAGDP